MSRTRAKLINYRIRETEPDLSYTASATECTGLMPTAPEDVEEFAAHQELYGMEIPRIESDHRQQITRKPHRIQDQSAEQE